MKKKPFRTWQLGKISFLNNLTLKNCLSQFSLVTVFFFLREQEQIFYTYSKLKAPLSSINGKLFVLPW